MNRSEQTVISMSNCRRGLFREVGKAQKRALGVVSGRRFNRGNEEWGLDQEIDEKTKK